MLLFRRRPRDKDGPTDEPADGRAASAPATGEPSVPPATGPTPPPAAAPPPSGPAAPPPLPQGPPGAGSSGEAEAKFPRCFVCRSPLEAGACPVCKITWVE
jgi:hypothetical protein